MVLPEVNGFPTEIPFPPTIILPLENCHSTVGSTARFSTTVVVQVRLYIPPAVDTPSEWIPSCRAGSASLNKERVLQFLESIKKTIMLWDLKLLLFMPLIICHFEHVSTESLRIQLLLVQAAPKHSPISRSVCTLVLQSNKLLVETVAWDNCLVGTQAHRQH